MRSSIAAASFFIRQSNFIGHPSTNGGAIGGSGMARCVWRTPGWSATWCSGSAVCPATAASAEALICAARAPGSVREHTWENHAQSFGGGVYRQGTGDDQTAIYGVSFQGNYVIPEHTAHSLGGALFPAGTHAVIEATTFYGNAGTPEAAYIGPSTRTLLLNSTFSQNAAERGGGGAVLFKTASRRSPRRRSPAAPSGQPDHLGHWVG